MSVYLNLTQALNCSAITAGSTPYFISLFFYFFIYLAKPESLTPSYALSMCSKSWHTAADSQVDTATFVKVYVCKVNQSRQVQVK